MSGACDVKVVLDGKGRPQSVTVNGFEIPWVIRASADYEAGEQRVVRLELAASTFREEQVGS